MLLDQSNELELISMTVFSSDSEQFQFEGLVPFTEYQVVLFANTSAGRGVDATVDFMTDIGSECCVCMHVCVLHVCVCM